MLLLILILTGCCSQTISWFNQVNGNWNNVTLWSPPVIPNGKNVHAIIGQSSWIKQEPIEIQIHESVCLDRLDTNYTDPSGIILYVSNSTMELNILDISYGCVILNLSTLSVYESLNIDTINLFDSSMFIYTDMFMNTSLLLSNSILYSYIPVVINHIKFINSNSTLKGDFIYTGNTLYTSLNHITVTINGSLNFEPFNGSVQIILKWDRTDLKDLNNRKYIIFDSTSQNDWSNLEIIFDPIMQFKDIKTIIHNNGSMFYIRFESIDSSSKSHSIYVNGGEGTYYGITISVICIGVVILGIIITVCIITNCRDNKRVVRVALEDPVNVTI